MIMNNQKLMFTNYETLNDEYYCDISYDKPISNANYDAYTNPSVILDGNIKTNIYLVKIRAVFGQKFII